LTNARKKKREKKYRRIREERNNNNNERKKTVQHPITKKNSRNNAYMYELAPIVKKNEVKWSA